MPYSYGQKTLYGTYQYSGGSTVLSGKNYYRQWTINSPNRESRPKPTDTSAFSLSSTSRTYYSKTSSDSQMGLWPISSGLEELPVGWHGGVGSWGDTLPVPYDLGTRLANRIKNQNLNLGITLAQYRELTTLWSQMTYALLDLAIAVQRLKDPRKWYKLYRKRKLAPKVRALAKGTSAVYIGYLFGLRQFVADFQASSEALRARFKDPMYLHENFTVNLRDTIVRKGNTGRAAYISTVDVTKKLRVKCRYRVFPNDQVLAQSGVTNPLALIYDAIPFSFILNWMIPVGQWLSALDALTGVSDLRWYYTSLDRMQNWVDYPMYRRSAVYSTESLSRSSVQTTVSNPLPRFRMSTNASNVVTGLALLSLLHKNPRTNSTVLLLKQ